MKKYKSANGKLIDMDGLRLANEDTIAVGNMRVNARGDELGAGGKVVKTRNQKMDENYKLHTMVPKDDVVHADAISADVASGGRGDRVQQVRDLVKRDTPEEVTVAETPEPKKVDFASLTKEEPPTVAKRSRGKLAGTVAANKPVEQNETSVPVKTVRRI